MIPYIAKTINGQRVILDNFDRSQEVKRIYVYENSRHILKEQTWTMDWSLDKKREVATDLASDAYIAYGIWDEEKIVGFVSVVRQLVGSRMVLDIIQVDRHYRRRGIGRQLWDLAVAEAEKAGAKELYISACCAEETVNFYQAMGAKFTEHPIPEIAEAEPYDMQMVCPVMQVVDFFESADQQSLIRKIEQGNWGAAKFLAKLLQEGTFQQAVGGGTVYLLMDGETIVSFVTLTRQDCIADESIYPWLGFFYTFPAYRGHRYGGKLLDYAAKEVKKQGHKQVYLATDHVGLYETYGFTYLENRIDIYGGESRVYVKNLGGNL